MCETLHKDSYKFISTYLISEEDVNIFQHNIKPRGPCKKKDVGALTCHHSY
jgi:hypothetical protein